VGAATGCWSWHARLYGGQVASDFHAASLQWGWKLAVAEFHATEALTATHALPTCPDKRREAAGLALLHMSGSDEAKPFSDAQFICEAHAIAAAQSLHSVTDIVSNVVYIGLGCGSMAASARPRRNLHIVQRTVEKSGIAPTVAGCSRPLVGLRDVQVSRAYVNTTKHVSLVDRASR